jgi:hypothetical protein
MRIIAFITDGPTLRDILDHLGEPTAPPRFAPASRPAHGHPGVGARPNVPPPAGGAACRHRKSMLDPTHRRPHPRTRAIEMTIRPVAGVVSSAASTITLN